MNCGAPLSCHIKTSVTRANKPQDHRHKCPTATAVINTKNKSNNVHFCSHVFGVLSIPQAENNFQPGGKCRLVFTLLKL